ncbi:MAG: T9SS type A sorting domain-containing protein [Fidelibacterota bacterium]
MKKHTFFFLAVLIFTCSSLSGRGTNWVYRPDMTIFFHEMDSLANPFLCDVDSAGNIWVLSSTSTSLNAHNALYKAEPGDTVFTLFEDYSSIPDVHSTRGLAAVNEDVFVAFRSTTTDISFVYEYPEGNPAAKIEYKGIRGFGTYVYGISVTKDRYMYGGIIYQGPRIRLWDFSGTSDPVGLYVSPETTERDPGGPTATGEDAIRDVAIQKDLDYSDSNSPVYTSRNSLPGGNQGGVTVWTGGVQTDPSGYTPQALEDADSFLKWTSYVPNGLFVDHEGVLWATGTDSTRRWVKGFQVDGSWATQVDELPSATSGDIADAAGAPLNVPEDVAISPDKKFAYVIDLAHKCCYVFSNGDVSSVREPVKAESFLLKPTYPNPFNASTQLSYQIPAASHVDLTLYSVDGKAVKTLYSGWTRAGTHSLRFDAPEHMPSGLYLVMMKTSFGQQVQKIALMK